MSQKLPAPVDGWISLSARTLRALDRIDEMPPDLRACVHDFSYSVVATCLNAGITDPRKIRTLVAGIWEGARQPHNRNSALPAESSVVAQLDWLLIQAGSGIGARRLIRMLDLHSMAIVPKEPSRQMIEASMDEITPAMGIISKYQKHRRRLVAATRAAVSHLWPFLLDEERR